VAKRRRWSVGGWLTIARLRRKLGEPDVIRTTPGVGYRIINEP
jgi:DNA-binding response OmpR family regulator